MFNGKMPKSKILPFEWYNTPNIHLLTIKDFYDFAKKYNFKIEKKLCMTRGKLSRCVIRQIFDNYLTEEVMFLCSQ
jgi:homoserine O-acetyltransferase